MESEDLTAFGDLLCLHKGAKTFAEIERVTGFPTQLYHSPDFNLPRKERLLKLAEAYEVSLEKLAEAYERVKKARETVSLARKEPRSAGGDATHRCFSRRGRTSARMFT